ncbi:MAG TPA: hypothetical protein VGB73_05650 [Pyrinomonadaceae bacterium]
MFHTPRERAAEQRRSEVDIERVTRERNLAAGIKERRKELIELEEKLARFAAGVSRTTDVDELAVVKNHLAAVRHILATFPEEAARLGKVARCPLPSSPASNSTNASASILCRPCATCSRIQTRRPRVSCGGGASTSSRLGIPGRKSRTARASKCVHIKARTWHPSHLER